MTRPKLSDILNGQSGDLAKAWTETEPAVDFAPLPAGEYVADIICGELFNSSKKGTPGFKLTFMIADGEHLGRRLWLQVWLTPAALPMAKRDLGKLGITALEQLERPLPAVMRCRVKVARREDDDGTCSNHVRSFEVVEVLGPDAFAPQEDAMEGCHQPDANVADPSNDEEPAASRQE